MLRLKCPSQNYAWGRLARSNSEVRHLLVLLVVRQGLRALSNDTFLQVAALTAAGGTKVDHEKPYAELW